MKKPREAPTFIDSITGVQSVLPARFVELIEKGRRLLPASSRYLHWDELQHREAPPGLSREEWWFLLKFSRQSLKQEVSLLDKSGNTFSYVPVPPIPQQLHEIDVRLGGQIKLPEEVINRETKDEYYLNSLIEEAITSSQLEGATTTRRVAKEMLRTGRAPSDRSERMILNNFRTMSRIGDLKGESLTKDLIFEIHRLVTEETLDKPSAAGRFRRDVEDEHVAVVSNDNQVLYEPPLASDLEARVQRVCEFANQSAPFVHPVIRSMILHFMIGYEHPFVDGNGRTARALFYWSMLHHGYWLAEFISISQIVLKAPAQYSRAFLYTETDERDLTYFILYHSKIVMRAIESLHEYIGRKTREIRAFEAELNGIQILNHRQRALIRHAMRHPGNRYSVEEHRRSHNVSYESARLDLINLAARGLFSSMRVGKKSLFSPDPQLATRLAALA